MAYAVGSLPAEGSPRHTTGVQAAGWPEPGSEVDDLVVALHAPAGHLRLDEVGDLGDLGAGGVPVLCRVGADFDEDVVRVLGTALEPRPGEGVPQLGELGRVVDDRRGFGQ